MATSLAIEYAPSGRSKCFECLRLIENRVIRFEYESHWFHLPCLPHPPLHLPAFQYDDLKGRGCLKKEHKERVRACFESRGESEVEERPTKLEVPPAEAVAVTAAGKNTTKKRKRAKDDDVDDGNKFSEPFQALFSLPMEEIRALPKKDLSDRLYDCSVKDLKVLMSECKYGSISTAGKDALVARVANSILTGLGPMCPVCHVKRLERMPREKHYRCGGGKVGFDATVAPCYEEHGSPIRFIHCTGLLKRVPDEDLLEWTVPDAISDSMNGIWGLK